MFKKFKALFGAQDMTVGSPLKCLLMFSVPLLIGNLAQLLYGTVDSIVVGKYVGDAALSAIGITSPIQNLFLVLFMAIGSGVMVMVSQYFGARDREALSHTIGNCIVLTIIASVFVLVFGVLATRPLLVALKTPESIIDWCASYLYILFIGGAGLAFYNILGGVLRGLGELPGIQEMIAAHAQEAVDSLQ